MVERCRQRCLRVLMLLLVTIFVAGCAGEPIIPANRPEAEVYCHVRSGGYCRALASQGVAVATSHGGWLTRELATGAAVEAFETQAHRGRDRGLVSSWRADYLATVVIAIDRDQTDAQIAGWKDLLTADEDVLIERVHDHWLLSAVEWGLTGELTPGPATYDLVAQLRRAGHWRVRGPQAPISITFDYQAADRITAGENLAVVVPVEGTLSFRRGLMSSAAELPTAPLGGDQLAAMGYTPASADPPGGARLVTGAELPYDIRFVADYRRFGMGERYLHSADSFEASIVPLVVMLLVIGWAGSFVRRGSQPSVRRAALAIGVLSVFWLLMRLLRYPMQDGLATELIWYAYYVAMLGLPMCLLWLAWAVDRAIDSGRPPSWWWLLLGLQGSLLGLVMTNTAHELVFSFPDAELRYSHYRYEAGYYIVLAACAIPLVVAISWLVIKSRRVPGRRFAWLPLLVVALMSGYVAGYVNRIEPINSTDLTVVVIGFGIALVEAAVRTRTLPLNTSYGALFAASSLNMRIVDADSSVQLTAAGSGSETPDAVNLVEFSAPIRGGKVVWTEDMTAIAALQRSTSIAVERMQGLNSMLVARREADRVVAAANARAKVLSEMETEVNARVAELDELVANLPEGPVDRISLARIALRACFVKRRAALFFQVHSGEVVTGDEMARHFGELAELAEPAGVRCAVQVSATEIEVWHSGLLYECVFRLLDQAVIVGARALVAHVDLSGADQSLRCLLPAEFDQFSFDDDLCDRLADIGAEVEWRAVDESHTLQITVPNQQISGQVSADV